MTPTPPVAATSTATASISSCTATTTVLPLESVDLLKSILSFVGSKQYLYVAVVNRRFKEAYLEIYNGNKETNVNISTEKLAKFCWKEIDHNHYAAGRLQRVLCASAAAHGSLPSLQYLRSMNCDWDAGTCRNASKNGHLMVLQWCRQNECPWDKWTCAEAAANDDLKVLQWCRENGCPWDEETCAYAAKNINTVETPFLYN